MNLTGELFERFDSDIRKLIDFGRECKNLVRKIIDHKMHFDSQDYEEDLTRNCWCFACLLAFWQHLSAFCLLFYGLMYLELWDMNLFLYLNRNKNPSSSSQLWLLAFTTCWLSILISQILSPPNSHHHIFWTTNIKADYTIQSHKIIVIIFTVHTTWLLSLTPMRCRGEQPAVVWRG